MLTALVIVGAILLVAALALPTLQGLAFGFICLCVSIPVSQEPGVQGWSFALGFILGFIGGFRQNIRFGVMV